jgi:hypothetical protein
MQKLARCGATQIALGRKGVAVNPRLFTFIGGPAGEWSVVEVQAVVGDGCIAG